MISKNTWYKNAHWLFYFLSAKPCICLAVKGGAYENLAILSVYQEYLAKSNAALSDCSGLS
ncbi:hypothetical protein, partial [Endozoicomonas numazuensis]|uniref:hypothetical protein n=1 Tax=Endozoicomonas numazuensis TaxID=1137799 RepID=UPI001F29FB9B